MSVYDAWIWRELERMRDEKIAHDVIWARARRNRGAAPAAAAPNTPDALLVVGALTDALVAKGLLSEVEITAALAKRIEAEAKSPAPRRPR